VQQAWIDAVDRLADPYGGETSKVVAEAKTNLEKLGVDDPAATKILAEALQVVQSSAVEPVLRDRARDALRSLRP
jgi:hypothetical protein